MNHVQQMWAVFNEVEDIRREEETLWEGLKLVASAQAPKGVKKIDDADRQRRASEESRRQQIMDRFYYMATGVLDEEGKSKEDGVQYVLQTKSVEDLEKEMYDWVAGKDDWHDQFVKDYKNQIISRYQKEREDAAARSLALREAQQEESGQEPAPLIGYSPAQLAEILKERGQGMGGARMVFDDPHRDFVYQKYVVRDPDSGRLRASDDGKLVVAGEGTETAYGEPEPVEQPPVPEMEY
jgi:hypothetical protein